MSEMVVPNDWSLVDIGNVCKFSQGVQIGVEFHYKENNHNRVRFLRISDYTKTDEEPRYVDNSLAVKGQMEKDDVVMVRYGEAGRVCRGLEGAIANNLFTITPQNSLIKDYLYLSLISPDVSERIYALAASSTMPAINFTSLSKIKLLLPDSQKEQQKIASILTSVDEVIEKTQSQINKLQDLKKGTMNELLTKGIGHTEFKDSPVGKIPVEWEVKRLGSVSTVQTGIAKNSKIEAETIEVPYLRVANVQDNYLNLEEIKTIKIIPSKVDRYLLKVGDVLMNEGGDYDKLGRGVVWKGEVSPCVHQNHVFVVRPNHHQLRSEFLNEFSSSEYGKRYFLGCSKQSTNLASINSTQLKDMKVIIPSIDEQKEIIAIASSITKKVELLSAKLEQTQSLKKSLMQDLLTGKVRVTVH